MEFNRRFSPDSTMAMLSVVLIVSCFFRVDARHRHMSDEKGLADSLSWARSCEPGKFYPGPECSKCFCLQERSRICGPPELCKLIRGPPSQGEIGRLLTVASHLDVLPAVDHMSAECEPGLLYRIDCNRCLCLERKSLTCETKLCPSYDNVYRIKASKMTGKPCQRDTVTGCVECTCKDQKFECRAKEICKPPSAKYKHKRRCKPGKKYKLKDGSGIKCTCSIDRKLSCGNRNIGDVPSQLDDEVSEQELPARESFDITLLKPKTHHAKHRSTEDGSVSEDMLESAPLIKPFNVALLKPKPHHSKSHISTFRTKFGR